MSTLDPVQIEALKFADGKRGIGWFMEMGLGKSLVALSEFARLYREGKVNRMIVVCPNSFKMGWQDEIEKHGFAFNTHIFRSAQKHEAGIWLRQPNNLPPVLIINYEAARLTDIRKGLAIWATRGKTYLAIDESIQIKGHKAAQTRAVHATRARMRLRPPPHRAAANAGSTRSLGPATGDRRCAAELLRLSQLVLPDGRLELKQVTGVKNAEELAAMMAPVVFQAKKADWLPSLPRKDFTIRDYKMSTEQLRQYTQMERQFLLEIEKGVITVDVAIAKYAKLAQIQCGFIYDETGAVHQLVHADDNPRLSLLKQILEEEVSGKVCVVYRHRAMFRFLNRALGEYDPAWIAGGMKPDDIAEQKKRFNEDEHCRIILLQCDAAKYGHTLLGGPSEDDLCRTMIFFENSYSADTRDQIEDRIHRRGQTGERVLYIDLSGSDLDRRIVKALQKKDAMYRSVFLLLRSAQPAAAE